MQLHCCDFKSVISLIHVEKRQCELFSAGVSDEGPICVLLVMTKSRKQPSQPALEEQDKKKTASLSRVAAAAQKGLASGSAPTSMLPLISNNDIKCSGCNGNKPPEIDNIHHHVFWKDFTQEEENIFFVT